MDILTPTSRSRIMSRTRGKDTKPEIAVRKAATSLGYRYRLHRRDLPGSPDLVFPRLKTVVFVHGCFWHRHPGCKYSYNPKSNVEFWSRKFQNNIARDERVKGNLERLGWQVVVIWECQTTDFNSLKRTLQAYLENEIGPQATDSAAKASPSGDWSARPSA
ncbi:very short patch repair endonuclease [Aestuariivirga sp.]|uniref:very short patch repair endonuclease n=1 Tax=Aestuariivirga sp. TaxID=2650926 RepID=UPI0039E61FE8